MTLDFHTVSCRLITESTDDLDKIEASFYRFLAGVDVAKERIIVTKDPFVDAFEKKRYLCMMRIEIARVVRVFVKQMFAALSSEQKKQIKLEVATRVDDECLFYLRFDKDAFVNDGKIIITEGGNCFHITLTVASFPHKKSVACSVVEKYLN